MKTALTFTAILFFIYQPLGKAQQTDTRTLLNKINNAILNLKEGQYNIHSISSREAVADSLHTTSIGHSYFRQLPSDNLLGYQISFANNYAYQEVYDGQYLYTIINKTLVITDKVNHPEKITAIKNRFYFYPLFVAIYNLILNVNSNNLKVNGTQLYKGELCYQLTQKETVDSTKGQDVSWYISVKTNIPIGQVVKLKSIIGQAEQTLVIENWISDLNTSPIPVNQFSKEKLISYTKEKQYNPDDKPNKDALLPVGSIAPDWELPLITGEKVRLSDLKGKIVIMDFWFKACAPCQAQMIALQKLNNKYDKQKVMFIGINTIDDFAKDQLRLFLEKRNITMPSVYNGKTIQGLYNAPYCPALFIINKDRKIVYTLEAESENLIEDVTSVIDKNLQLQIH